MDGGRCVDEASPPASRPKRWAMPLNIPDLRGDGDTLPRNKGCLSPISSPSGAESSSASDQDEIMSLPLPCAASGRVPSLSSLRRRLRGRSMLILETLLGTTLCPGPSNIVPRWSPYGRLCWESRRERRELETASEISTAEAPSV